MSKGEVLYVKGMHASESEDEEVEEDIWDDRKLNDAYDKALRIANSDVAQRVAMATNTQPGGKDSKKSKDKSSKSSNSKNTKKDKIHWRAGMPCRAIYDEDGLEYEAYVLRIINDKECIVKFLGYENSEIVPLNSLKQSHGKEERSMQFEEAIHERSGPANQFDREVKTERVSCSQTTDHAVERRKKSPKKSKNINQMNGFDLPDPPMPNMSFFRNVSNLDMPIPPPPMTLPPTELLGNEEQAISSMLLSWYMSGYYTGLYQGLKRAKESRRDV